MGATLTAPMKVRMIWSVSAWAQKMPPGALQVMLIALTVSAPASGQVFTKLREQKRDVGSLCEALGIQPYTDTNTALNNMAAIGQVLAALYALHRAGLVEVCDASDAPDADTPP